MYHHLHFQGQIGYTVCGTDVSLRHGASQAKTKHVHVCFCVLLRASFQYDHNGTDNKRMLMNENLMDTSPHYGVLGKEWAPWKTGAVITFSG